MPILVSPANRSLASSASATTRLTTRPTVAHATRSSWRTACLQGVHRQPRRGVVERAGVPGAVARPGHLRDDHAVLRAAHPGGVGFQVGPHRAEVQRPPAPPALTLVVAGTAPPAHPAAPLGALAGPDRDHDRLGVLVELHPLDHGPLDTEQPGP